MPDINFYLTNSAMDRLFAIKKLQGKDDMTGNEFAAQMLEDELYRLFPAAPNFDEHGNLLNPERYRG